MTRAESGEGSGKAAGAAQARRRLRGVGLAQLGVVALGSVALLGAAACTPIRDQRGFVPDEALPTEIKPQIDTRATVLQRLGTPTSTANFNEKVWYYISYNERSFAFYNAKVTKRKITMIEFGDDDVVAKVSELGLKDGHNIKLVKRITPTRGRQLGVFEQIFGTIGRLPTDPNAGGPGSQQNPGGGTGR